MRMGRKKTMPYVPYGQIMPQLGDFRMDHFPKKSWLCSIYLKLLDGNFCCRGFFPGMIHLWLLDIFRVIKLLEKLKYERDYLQVPFPKITLWKFDNLENWKLSVIYPS
jgi:hypothetical protein